MPIHAFGELAGDDRSEERTEVDPHVEDREPGVTPLVPLFIQRPDEGRNVRLEQPGPYHDQGEPGVEQCQRVEREREIDRKSTRLNSSHLVISYAVFCLKKKN